MIFDQAVRAYSRFGPPIVPVKGVHTDLGPHYNLLGDHFTPLLAVLAPLYRLHPDVPTLLVAQAALFALSVVPVWVVARRLLAAWPAYLLAGAYALSWGLQTALATDFHEVAFAVPLIALALERAQARRPGQATACFALLLLVKEDYGLFLVAAGAYLAVAGHRRHGLGLAVAGAAGYELTTRVLIPHFSGQEFAYWTYTALGPDLPSALGHLVRHPLDALHVAVTPEVKARTLRWLFGPWLFVPLLSPVLLLAVPVLAERMLSGNWHYWGTAFHYSAPLMPVLAVGAADGLARLGRRLPAVRRATPAAAAVMLLVAVGACALFPFRDLGRPDWWRRSETQAAAYRAMARIPDGVTVEAESRLGPHLTARTTVLMLDATPRGAPWAILSTREQYFPFSGPAQERGRLRRLLRDGYRVTYADGGYTVLHRG